MWFLPSLPTNGWSWIPCLRAVGKGRKGLSSLCFLSFRSDPNNDEASFGLIVGSGIMVKAFLLLDSFSRIRLLAVQERKNYSWDVPTKLSYPHWTSQHRKNSPVQAAKRSFKECLDGWWSKRLSKSCCVSTVDDRGFHLGSRDKNISDEILTLQSLLRRQSTWKRRALIGEARRRFPPVLH